MSYAILHFQYMSLSEAQLGVGDRTDYTFDPGLSDTQLILLND